MDDEERGFDVTVTRASRKEAQLFRDVIVAYVQETKAVSTNGTLRRTLPWASEAIDDMGVWPFWKIGVVNDATGDSSKLVINRALTTPTTLHGRGGRTYLAYDLGKGCLVFLKDSWRGDGHGMRPEFRTYQILAEHSVPHIPRLLYGGDVLYWTPSETCKRA